MKNIFYIRNIGVVGILVFSGSLFAAQEWGSNPNNWENNPNNWDNSSNNWNNNPRNWDNSPNKYGNDRIIYDVGGNPTGYAVPKDSGGVNLYDFEGNRRGYTPVQ